MNLRLTERQMRSEGVRTLLTKWNEVQEEKLKYEEQLKPLRARIRELENDQKKFEEMILNMIKTDLPDVYEKASQGDSVNVRGTNLGVTVKKSVRTESMTKGVMKRNILLFAKERQLPMDAKMVDELITFIYANRSKTKREYLRSFSLTPNDILQNADELLDPMQRQVLNQMMGEDGNLT